MSRLVIIHGPANSGKLAAMWATASADRDLRVLHRDQVRLLFGRLISEAHLTEIMGDMALGLLQRGYSVITCGQNETDDDARLWEWVAVEGRSTIEWCSGLA